MQGCGITGNGGGGIGSLQGQRHRFANAGFFRGGWHAGIRCCDARALCGTCGYCQSRGARGLRRSHAFWCGHACAGFEHGGIFAGLWCDGFGLVGFWGGVELWNGVGFDGGDSGNACDGNRGRFAGNFSGDGFRRAKENLCLKRHRLGDGGKTDGGKVVLLGKGFGLVQRFARNGSNKRAASIAVKVDDQIVDRIGGCILKRGLHIRKAGLGGL